jgi:F-type H+-transporting ATPase subunit gamma
MSGTTDGLRRKITGAGDLQGVVRSMKALAASSIGQYEKAVLSLDVYYRTVELALTACLRQSGPSLYPEERRPAKENSFGAIVFGSDQGLVGRFNEVLAEFVAAKLKTLPGKPKKIWAIGDRIHALLLDGGTSEIALSSVPNSVNAITSLVTKILIEVESAMEGGKIIEVYVFHNRPKSGALYEPTVERLLPLDHAWQSKLSARAWPTKNLPEVIGDPADALRAFIRGYLFVLLFQACAESLAGENASRLGAMQRADKNINEILDHLNRTFHRLRQETIDEELFDVISGYEALVKKRSPMSVRAATNGDRGIPTLGRPTQ